jgi:methylmalonyl-CoA mutase C-terminal domain/subunit
VSRLKEAGITEIFTPGTPTSDIVQWVNEHVGATTG